MMRILKTYWLLFLMTVVLVLFIYSQRKGSRGDSEYYGNTFIAIDESAFKPSILFRDYSLADSAFFISIPTYMEQRIIDGSRLLDSNEVVFRYDDSQTPDEYKYGRVWIEHTKVEAGEAKFATDFLDVNDSSTKSFLESLVNAALGKSLNSPSRKHGVPSGQIINGPFYRCIQINSDGDKPIYALDAFYRREGHTDGKGPVSCHIFFLQNYDEVVRITMSYHDVDSTSFYDLFNSIKTFRWNNYKRNEIKNYSEKCTIYDNKDKYSLELPNILEIQKSELNSVNSYVDSEKKLHITISSLSDQIVFQQSGLNDNEISAYSKYCRLLIHYYQENSDDPVYGYGDQIAIDKDLLYNVYSSVWEACNTNKTPLLKFLNIQTLNINGFPVLYYSYRRMGWLKEDGKRQPPVIVNVYTVFNKYESVILTFSYREAEREIWKEINNNIVKSFIFINKY